MSNNFVVKTLFFIWVSYLIIIISLNTCRHSSTLLNVILTILIATILLVTLCFAFITYPKLPCPSSDSNLYSLAAGFQILFRQNSFSIF